MTHRTAIQLKAEGVRIIIAAKNQTIPFEGFSVISADSEVDWQVVGALVGIADPHRRLYASVHRLATVDIDHGTCDEARTVACKVTHRRGDFPHGPQPAGWDLFRGFSQHFGRGRPS